MNKTNNQSINALPETGFIRLSQVLQFIPVCRTKWYAGVKAGQFPAPIKIGSGRAAFYKTEEIKALIEKIGNKAEV